MQYRLYDNEISTDNIVEKVLWNRGIKDFKTYMNLNASVEIPYNKLHKIKYAVEMFTKHYNNNDIIAILVDPDVDGYTSAASMYQYIKRLNPNYPVAFIMHQAAKSHGLSSKDIVIPSGTKLFIIPDAGTNDYEECKELIEDKVVEDILILDHHEAGENGLKNNTLDHVVIVNNQMSEDYDNKDLSGVGIVYKFLQALDNELWCEYADDFLDLVALGNISDVMDMRSFETRYLTEKGLKSINNKCFKALIKAQEFSMKNKINIHNVQWFCTPVLNGCIRVGSDEEKELLFRAFIEEDRFFEYNKRATKNKPAETIQESIYDRAARLSKNAKSRQDKLRDKYSEEILKLVKNKGIDENKVIMVDVSDILEHKSLTGVIAIKIAEVFNRPCILLKKYLDAKTNTVIYGGSARNVDHSPIESFKNVVNNTQVFEYAEGHPNAFGQGLKLENIQKANEKFNDVLADVVYDSTYKVDYIFDADELSPSFPIETEILQDIVAQGIDEPLIAVENIYLSRDELSLIGKNSNTLKFTLPNGIEFVQFYCKEGMPLYDWVNETWDASNEIEITVVGTPGINEFNGVKTPQIVISNVNIISCNKNDDIDDEDIW